MSKSNISPAKASTEVAMRRPDSQRMRLFSWLISVFAIGGYAMASPSDHLIDSDFTDFAPFATKATAVQLTVDDNEARTPSDGLAGSASAHTDLLSDEAKSLTGQDSEADRLEEEEMNALQAFSTTRGMVLILPDLIFRSRDPRLSSSALRALEPLVQFLIKHPDRPVEIDGFSDGLGSIQDNQTISQQRSETVKSTLVARGATAAQISAYGYGSQAPVASDNESVGRRRNRRIEIVIGNKDAAIPGWSDL